MTARHGLAFLLACSALIAHAGEPTSALSACLEGAIEQGALINGARLKCLESELNALDRQLDRIRREDLRAQQRLADALAHWKRYRTAWCAYRSQATKQPNRYVNEALCRVEMTQTKLDELRASRAAQ